MSNFDDLLIASRFTGTVGASLGVPLPELQRQVKTAFYTQLLAEYNGNLCRAARSVGMHRNTLTKLVRALQIPRKHRQAKPLVLTP